MSDGYRKDYRRKGEYGGHKDFRGRGAANRLDREYYGKKSSSEKGQQPTILLKARETERAPSPAASSAANVTPKKDVESSTSYQIQTKATSVEVPEVPTMLLAVPLLSTDSLSVSCLEYLTDHSDFLVVGCLGCPGVGKSTLMSYLAQSNLEPLENKPYDIFKPNRKRVLFPQQDVEDVSFGEGITSGINLYVTKNRIILLDCEAVFNNPVSGSETNSEMQSLELAAFLFSVCHVVLFIQDHFLDPDLIRLLQTAEMLKPSTSTAIGETVVEYFPHLLFVHNMAEDWEFEARRIKQIQEIYLKIFCHSRLQIQTGFGIANGDVSPILDTSTCGELVNVFLLPKFSSDEQMYTGHPSFKDLFHHFRNQILSTPRTSISHALLTEKNWFHYACKVWEGIQKSSFFNEYHRLISNM